MAGNYSILSTFNQKSMEKMDKTSYARSNTADISIYDIYSNEQNFYDQKGVEQKAQEIFAVGLIEPLAVVPDAKEIDGELKHYRLVSGERRWRALLLLASRGQKRFELVTCKILEFANEHEEKVSLIIANSYRQKSLTTLIREEQELKSTLEHMKQNGIALNGFDLSKGKIRDVIASLMNISKTKVAEIEAVSNHLNHDFRNLLENDQITFSAAYQLSKLAFQEQDMLFERYNEVGELSYKDVMKYVEKKKEEEQKAQLPGQMDIADVEALLEETRVDKIESAGAAETDDGKIESAGVAETDDETIEDTQMDSIQEETPAEDDESKKSQDGVQKEVINYDIPSDISVLKTLIDSAKRYLYIARNDKSVTEIAKKKYEVSLRAYEFYLDSLNGEGE